MKLYVLLITLTMFAADDKSLSSLHHLSSSGSRGLATHPDAPLTPVSTPHHSPDREMHAGVLVHIPQSLAAIDQQEHRAPLQEIEKALDENAFWSIVSFCAILFSLYFYNTDQP